MKLSGREANGFFKSPDTTRAGILIYGADPMRVAERRKQVVNAILGENGAEEMRLTRLSAAEARKNGAMITDGIKSPGFFPGPRVVMLEDASDALTKTIDAALSDWRAGDAMLVVTAGQLAARSSLRKWFEAHKNAVAIAIYTDPPGPQDVSEMLAKAGIATIEDSARDDLMTLARALEPGDFRQLVEKLSLYTLGQDGAVSSEDVAACAPMTVDSTLDDALHAISEARISEIGPLIARLKGQGLTPTSICIGATRHFRALHMAAIHKNGPEAGLSACKPPVFGPRRDRMVRQSRNLGVRKIETALAILTDTDLALRSSAPAPAHPMLERALIRIAMNAQSRG